MNREEQLKQAIADYYKVKYNPKEPLLLKPLMDFIGQIFSEPNLLRHTDPEIMKQAGWMREEEWISVEDRLPDASDSDVLGNVLVCDFTVPVRGVYVSNYMFVDKKYHTHWKPLPNPPKQ